MEAKVMLDIFLPIALGVIMLGLGLSLTTEDFKRVLLYPKAVIVGLLCQMILLPLICLAVARMFGLAPALAVGLMLLAASPGGATANLYSHLAHGDVALNISLTAINSVLSLFTLPLIVNLSLDFFMGESKSIPMQFKKVLEVFAIVLIPVTLGMFLRAKSGTLAEKLNKPVKIFSAIFLIAIVAGAVASNKAIVVKYFTEVGLAALTFNVLSMGVGFFVPLLLTLGKKQAVAIGMEIGIHNGTLAIYIANNALNNEMMSFPPAIYSLIMFITAGIFGYIVSRKKEAV